MADPNLYQNLLKREVDVSLAKVRVLCAYFVTLYLIGHPQRVVLNWEA
jgi:hypothetical protein